MGARRRTFLWAVSAAVVGAAAVWLFMNGSMARLSKAFIPRMRRLEALRDGLDGIRRAIVTHDLVLSGLPTCGPLLDWSWRDLTRLEFAQYHVLGTDDRARSAAAGARRDRRGRLSALCERFRRRVGEPVSGETRVPPALSRRDGRGW